MNPTGLGLGTVDPGAASVTIVDAGAGAEAKPEPEPEPELGSKKIASRADSPSFALVFILFLSGERDEGSLCPGSGSWSPDKTLSFRAEDMGRGLGWTLDFLPLAGGLSALSALSNDSAAAGKGS